MKRISIVLLGLVCIAGLGAQELKLGTIEGTAFYAPIVVKVLKEAGFDAQIVTYPKLESVYPDLARGVIDGAFFLAQPVIVQLNGAVMVPVRLMQTDFCAVTLDPDIKVANPGDLRRYSVGVVKDQAAHAAITRGMTTIAAPSDVEQFKMLAAGKFQVAISVDMAVPGYCAAAGIKTYYLQKPPLLMSPTFLALARKQAGIEPKLTAVLKAWVESGKWKEAVAAANAEAAKKK